jgi:hypothetical protein
LGHTNSPRHQTGHVIKKAGRALHGMPLCICGFEASYLESPRGMRNGTPHKG